MARPKTKAGLLAEMQHERDELLARLSSLPEAELAAAGCVGTWSVKDTVAHLADWERLLLDWYAAGRRGEVPHLPAEGYTWKQMDDLNEKLFEAHRDEPADAIFALWSRSYGRTHEAIAAMSEEELFGSKRFAWTGKATLADYVDACAGEHYRWARTEIRKGMRARQKKVKG